MKKLTASVLVAAAFSGTAHAGFSIGMTGAFKKQAAKLDDSVRQKTSVSAAAPVTKAPAAPTSLTAVAVSSSQINLSWTASVDAGVTSYKVYRNGVPVSTVAGTTFDNTGLTVSTAYTYTASACDAAGSCSAQSSAVSHTLPPQPAAGGEWVFVPGSLSLGATEFYVMKYEAKNVGGAAFSQADVTPWVSISQTSAITACSALGAGYHLLTIPEAQTINRNIEAQAANWADGTIGSLVSAGGGLKRGNAGITDSASYAGGSALYGTVRDAKSKFVLSNGGELWDWSGNVWEWIYGAGPGGTLGTPGGVTFYDVYTWLDWNSTTTDLTQERPILGPSGASYDSTYGVGQYYGGPTDRAVQRGGSWLIGVGTGVFSFRAGSNTTYTATSIGFRCAR